MKNFKNKSVLVTGSCGTIGVKLIEHLIKGGVKKIVGLVQFFFKINNILIPLVLVFLLLI